MFCVVVCGMSLLVSTARTQTTELLCVRMIVAKNHDSIHSTTRFQRNVREKIANNQNYDYERQRVAEIFRMSIRSPEAGDVSLAQQ